MPDRIGDEMTQAETAEDIVRALAAIEDPTVDDRDYAPTASCGLCNEGDPDLYRHVLDDPSQHKETCPWRRAREWVGRAGKDGS